jgi:hypothetical protein
VRRRPLGQEAALLFMPSITPDTSFRVAVHAAGGLGEVGSSAVAATSCSSSSSSSRLLLSSCTDAAYTAPISVSMHQGMQGLLADALRTRQRHAFRGAGRQLPSMHTADIAPHHAVQVLMHNRWLL